MSLWVGLQQAVGLAGVVSMSGYLPKASDFNPSEVSKQTPVLFCHGTSDAVVAYDWGKSSRDAVESAGVKDVTFRTYQGMGHSACEEELRDVFQFLTRVIPPN